MPASITEYGDKPWRDEELLKRLYLEEKMSLTQISKELDCSMTTVRKWLQEFGVEIRPLREALRVRYGEKVPYTTQNQGYESWMHTHKQVKKTVHVHRLAAVAWFGFDAVSDNIVHHKNEIPWDNREENLELQKWGEHSAHHRTKFDPEERQRIADLYADTDMSSREVAEYLEYDISFATVLDIDKELNENAD